MTAFLLDILARFWKPIACVVALTALAGYLVHLGAAHEATKRDLATALERQAKAEQQAMATLVQLSQYAAAVKRSEAINQERAKASARIASVTKETKHAIQAHVPASAPALPGGWRVLHDSAAAGVPPPASGASTPSQPDAAPVSAAAAAETVIGNYGTYHQLANQLLLLQRWVTQECVNANER